MATRCPACRKEVYGWKRMLAITAVTPGRCPDCGSLAGPSWWNLVAVIAMSLLPIFGLYASLVWKTWIPVSAGVLLAGVILYLQLRYLPLAVMTPREVLVHRVIGLAILAGLIVWAILGGDLMTKEDLDRAGYQLAEEIRGGKWEHVANFDKEPAPQHPQMIDELRTRCPGFTTEQYERAIAEGLFDSR